MKNQVSPPAAHHRAAGGLGQHVGVVGPVDDVRRAGRAGQVRGRGAGVEEDLVLLPHDAVRRRARRRRSARRRSRRRRRGRSTGARRSSRHRACSGGRPASTSTLMPALRDAEFLAPAQLHRLSGARAADVAIEAGLVVQHADPDRVGRLRAGGAVGQCAPRRGGGRCGAEKRAAVDGHRSFGPSLVKLVCPVPGAGQTPRYSCSRSSWPPARWFATMSTTRPCSIT